MNSGTVDADSVPRGWCRDADEPTSLIQTNAFSLRWESDGNLALYRAVQCYHNPEVLAEVRERIAALDFSWEKAAAEYIDIYDQMI